MGISSELEITNTYNVCVWKYVVAVRCIRAADVSMVILLLFFQMSNTAIDNALKLVDEASAIASRINGDNSLISALQRTVRAARDVVETIDFTVPAMRWKITNIFSPIEYFSDEIDSDFSERIIYNLNIVKKYLNIQRESNSG